MDQRSPRRLGIRRCLEKAVVGESIRHDALPGLEDRRVLAHLLQHADAGRRDFKVPAVEYSSAYQCRVKKDEKA